jgi:hypothetical protein
LQHQIAGEAVCAAKLIDCLAVYAVETLIGRTNPKATCSIEVKSRHRESAPIDIADGHRLRPSSSQTLKAEVGAGIGDAHPQASVSSWNETHHSAADLGSKGGQWVRNM